MNFPVSFQARSSIFESIGLEYGHRKSLIPIVTFEVLLWIQPPRHSDDTHEDLKCLRDFSRFPLSLAGQAGISGYSHQNDPESGRRRREALPQEVQRRARRQILCTQQEWVTALFCAPSFVFFSKVPVLEPQFVRRLISPALCPRQWR